MFSCSLVITVPIVDERNALLSIHDNRSPKSPLMPVVTATAHAPVAPPPLDANAGMDAPAAIARNKSICKMRQVSTNSDVLNHECWFDTYTYSLLLLAALPVLKLAIANFPISMYYLQF